MPSATRARLLALFGCVLAFAGIALLALAAIDWADHQGFTLSLLWR